MTVSELVREYVHYYGILLTEEARIGFRHWLKREKPEVSEVFEHALARRK